jgi:phage virion morphogenesis protein
VIPVTISVNATRVNARLGKIQQANTDFTPLMKRLAGFMHDRIEQNFEEQGRPAKWEPLKPSTVARRGNSSPILVQTGRLVSSITPYSDSTSATVGTNVVYAGTMHFGAKKGAFGQYSPIMSSKQRETFKRAPVISIPWGNIPARPFMTLTREDQGTNGLLGYVIDYQKGAAE